ncbi:hypothetical protein IQ272_27105 [Chroococcidiopsidales cyanobacterium LEGE 13417]|nr:hypothetical protein [Chroococcidiopsidales cyanobacterium LEGE 13417]
MGCILTILDFRLAILDLERKYHLVLMVRSLLAYPILGVGSRESGVVRIRNSEFGIRN